MTQSAHDGSAGKPRNVAVIGAGITGLAATLRLLRACPSVNVTLLESSSRLGGIIRTEEADGFLMELGPDSFITNKPGAVQLCDELGYSDQLIPTDAAFRRSLVLRNGQPLPVPDGFMLMAPANQWAVASTPILSLRGKLRLLAERFVPRRTTDDDESLADFVRRRFGRETLDRLVQPLVGGIYTSDPERLSLQATLPRFPEMERTYGSVIRATQIQEKQKRRAGNHAAGQDDSSGSGARYGLFATPAMGLSHLIAAIEQSLCSAGRVCIRRKSVIAAVRPEPSADVAIRWHVDFASSLPSETFDAVIVTLPTYQAASLLHDETLAPLAAKLNEIEYASSAIVVSGHRTADFVHPLDAFGLVIPAAEHRDILAVSFSSRKFPGRAPDGHVLLRTFVGGAMQPELLDRDDDALTATVNRELTSLLGMSAEPLFSEVLRYERAMPQYHVGHLQRIAEIQRLTAQHPGLALAGSAYDGVGIPDSIASGRAAADRVLQCANPPSE